MKKLVLIALALLMLTATGCRRYIYRKPVKRPVEYVPDSLVHNDISPEAGEQAEDEFLNSMDEGIMAVPDIPKESDLLQKDNEIDVEKLMREGF